MGILDTLILNPWRICTVLISMGSLCSSLLVYSIYSTCFPGNFILSDKANPRVIALVAFSCQGGLSCSFVLITWDTVDLSITLGNVRMDFSPCFIQSLLHQCLILMKWDSNQCLVHVINSETWLLSQHRQSATPTIAIAAHN